MKQFILYILLVSNAYSQNGKVFETYKTDLDSTNESNGTIFTKPFQEYNYIKTHRGIEVYQTYKSKIDSTNQSHGTIFSKPFPEFIIINNNIYRTYKSKLDSTNESNGTIFNKPFQSKEIMNIQVKDKLKYQANKNFHTKHEERLPLYDGQGDIKYGE